MKKNKSKSKSHSTSKKLRKELTKKVTFATQDDSITPYIKEEQVITATPKAKAAKPAVAKKAKEEVKEAV
jgi:hypothetical protein